MLDPKLIDSQLSIEEYKRYSRHLVLDEVGKTGQSRLKFSKVLIVGLGGLGSLASMYLASAGIGQIGIVEYDTVSLSNLQRQILYDTRLVNKKKSLVGKARLQYLNPHCRIIVFDTKLSAQNASAIVTDYDVIVDASDNFLTRYLLNDIAVLFNIPVVYGAILRKEGQISVFNYRGGPIFRDLFHENLQHNTALSCSEGGVFGGVVAVISSLQVNEVVKIILGLGNVTSGNLLVYDFSRSIFKTVSLKKKLVYSRKEAAKSLEGLNADEEARYNLMKYNSKNKEVHPSEIMSHVNNKSCLVIDVRTKQEYEIVHLTDAQNVPLKLLLAQPFLDFVRSKIAKDFYLLIYCSADSRSITATNMLSQLQIDSMRLSGGLKALGF
nr:moeB [Erythrotrichia welwitschii]